MAEALGGAWREAGSGVEGMGMDDVLASKLAELLAVELPKYAERTARVEATQAILVANVAELTAVTKQVSEFVIRHDQEEKTQREEQAQMHMENQSKMDSLSWNWKVIVGIATLMIALSQFFAPEIRSILHLKPIQTTQIGMNSPQIAIDKFYHLGGN